jgi:hypothetical protein
LRLAYRNVFEDGGGIGPDSQHAVHEIRLSSKGHDGLADNSKLLIAHKVSVLDNDHAGMNLAGSGELEEVGHVASDYDAVVGVRPFKHGVVCGFEKTAISNVNRVDTVGLAERFGHGWGQVLIEQ